MPTPRNWQPFEFRPATPDDVKQQKPTGNKVWDPLIEALKSGPQVVRSPRGKGDYGRLVSIQGRARGLRVGKVTYMRINDDEVILTLVPERTP